MEWHMTDRAALRELSLFAGYGGFSLGLKLAGIPMRTVGYVEIDPYCQAIIQARIRDGLLDDAPIYPDISAFDGNECRGVVDIITGGFPCQDLSLAGHRVGLDGDRSGLWWEMLRCVRDVGPRYVLIENVSGILLGGEAGRVVGELSQVGYDTVWHCVPAAAIGAPHLRWRWWCLGVKAESSCSDTNQQRPQGR